MSEASCTAFGRVERVYLLPLCLFIACNDELCDTVAVGDCKGLGREIDKNNTCLLYTSDAADDRIGV